MPASQTVTIPNCFASALRPDARPRSRHDNSSSRPPQRREQRKKRGRPRRLQGRRRIKIRSESPSGCTRRPPRTAPLPPETNCGVAPGGDDWSAGLCRAPAVSSVVIISPLMTSKLPRRVSPGVAAGGGKSCRTSPTSMPSSSQQKRSFMTSTSPRTSPWAIWRSKWLSKQERSSRS